jgi:hypothetical protein
MAEIAENFGDFALDNSRGNFMPRYLLRGRDEGGKIISNPSRKPQAISGDSFWYPQIL